jgi:tetratricopeptide (TPR) repeat protein
METGSNQIAQETSQRSPEFAKILVLLREGRLKDAEAEIFSYLRLSNISNGDRLVAYAHLIRISAEVRSFDSIPNYIEEIKKIPLNDNADRVRFAKCLHMTGTAWLHSGSSEKARTSFQQSLDIANELSDSELIFLNRLALVELLRVEGQYQQVLEQIGELQQSAQASGHAPHVGSVHILLGNVYRKQGNYSSAVIAYDQAREIFGENKNSGRYHYVLWALGTCYAALEDKEKAKIYLELASHVNNQSVEFWRINVLSNLTLAELHTVVGEYTKAENLYKKVEDAAGSDENSYFGRRVLRGQTLLAIKKGQFDLANELIDRLVIVAVREKNQGEIMRLRLLKAEVLLRNGEAAQHDEARAMLQEALAYFKERGVKRHQAISLELLARLDSRSGYPADAHKKVQEMLIMAEEAKYDRLIIRAQLAKMVLDRKLGRQITQENLETCSRSINRINSMAERVILQRFTVEGYDEWTQELARLDTHFQRYVNEFFEDFHFVPNQTIDIEIDQNSHYVREKHLGEIPFHNKFTLMRILCLLAETPGKEYSKEQLAKEIWGQEYNPLRHDNNIYININRLRKLIEPNPRESRYVMNGSRGYYFNPAMKVNISSKISDVAPRIQALKSVVKSPSEGPRP